MVRVALLVGLVVAVLGGLGLMACGGSDRLSAKDYRAKLTDLSKREDLVHADLEKLRKAKSGAEIRKGLVAAAAVQELLGGEAEKLKPPKNAEKPNALFARGARDVVLTINELVSGLPVTKSPRVALKRLNAVRNGRGRG
jgi:hypothetical protein